MAVRVASVHPGGWYSRAGPTPYLRTMRASARDRGVGARGVVAATVLDPVEGPVGGGDQLGGAAPVLRERGRADGRADRHRAAALAREMMVAERRDDAGRDLVRLVGIGLGQDDRELVAAIAGGHV